MGQNQNRQQTEADFTLSGWNRQQTSDGATVWIHTASGQMVEQYPFMSNNNEEYLAQVDAFNHRLSHKYLVTSKYLTNHPIDNLCGCGATYQGQIFLQRIQLRLSDINEIPFPDILHVYSQAFHGFSQLIPLVGCFIVQQDMIGINSQDIVKVWLSSNLGNIIPQSIPLNTEFEMIETIIDKIDKNTYKSSLPSNIREFFSSKNIQTFQQAILALEQYTKIYNTSIPLKLDCITQHKLQKQTTIIASSAGNLVVDNNVLSIRAPSLVGSSYKVINTNPIHIPRGHVRSSSVVYPSRTISNLKINHIPEHKQGTASQLIIKRPVVNQNRLSQTRMHTVSPAYNKHVPFSPKKTSTAKNVFKSPIINPTPVSNAIVNRAASIKIMTPVIRRVEDGHSNSNILNIIKQNRQSLPPQSKIYTEIPASPIKPILIDEDYKQFSPKVSPRDTKFSQNITTQSQLQSQLKQSEVSNFTRQIYKTPSIAQIDNCKFVDLASEYKASLNQSERRIQNDEYKQSRGLQIVVEDQNKVREQVEMVQIQKKTTKEGFGSTGTTSFQFFGYVGVGNSPSKKQKQIIQQVTQTKIEAYNSRTLNEQYLNNNTSYIQSRIQPPQDTLNNFSTGYKEQTYQSTPVLNNNINHYEIACSDLVEKYTSNLPPLDPIQPYNYQSAFDSNKHSINNYQPYVSSSSNYTFGLENKYLNNYSSSNDYMDIYNISSNTYNLTPVTHDYTNIASSYLNTNYNYNTDYTSNYTNNYTTNPIDSYKNYDYDTQKYNTFDTYIVPSYDTYNIASYDNLNLNLKDTNHNLKETHASLNTYTSNASQLETNIKYSSTKQLSNNYNTTQYTAKVQKQQINIDKYNVQHLASIYIPIQGYRVTLDNEVLADLQKLRSKTLIQQAIQNEIHIARGS